MASAVATAALRDYIVANFTSYPLRFENEGTNPPGQNDDGSLPIWIWVEIESGEDDQASIGGGSPEDELWREFGSIKFEVLIPVGGGTHHGLVVRDQLASLFRGLRINSLVCGRMDRSRGYLWESEGEGNWWALPLTVEWYLDSN